MLDLPRFVFEGFLPAKQAGRQKKLHSLANETRTMVFFEAPHRLKECVSDMGLVFGQDRVVTIARELTKVYEQIVRKQLGDMIDSLANGEIVIKGEFVIVVKGAVANESIADARQLLTLLLAEMSPAKAAGIANKLTGQSKKELYQMTLEIKASAE